MANAIQHRRSRTNGVNGDGAPLADDMLEGEIAINLPNRKIYTKRPTYNTTQDLGEVTAFTENAGWRFTITSWDAPADETGTYALTIDSSTVNISFDSEGADPRTVATIIDKLDRALSSYTTSKTASTLTAYKNSTATISFPANWVSHVSYSSEDVSRFRVDALDFKSQPVTAYSSQITVANNSTTIRRQRGNGVLIAPTSNSGTATDIYLLNFLGNIDTAEITANELELDLRVENGTEVVELNNVPLDQNVAPTTGLSAGNWWIDSSGGIGHLYWFDTSLENDSTLQTSIRGLTSTQRSDRGLVAFDSDGGGNDIYGEWREIVTNSLADSSAVPYDGVFTFNDDVNFGEDIVISGNAQVDGTLDVTGAVDLSSTLDVANAVTMDSTLTVAGQTNLHDHVNLGNASTDTISARGSFDTNLVPTGTRDVGTSTNQWRDFYASGLFRGTATAARYADLAEYYLADKEYEVGTVIAVGGDAEVTAASTSNQHSVLGVVSENPAFIMNSELVDGTAVALKGRVPVKVNGEVRKGDRLAPSTFPGYAKVDNSKDAWSFAIALEDGEGVVEAIIL